MEKIVGMICNKCLKDNTYMYDILYGDNRCVKMVTVVSEQICAI